MIRKKWDKIYQKEMDAVREWLTTNQKEVLTKYNDILFLNEWNKYAQGSLSKWEMDSICFYYHEHELNKVNKNKYGISNFFDLNSEPEIDYMFKKIPVYKTYRIVGTVIAKVDAKSTVTLLSPEGVFNVKFTKEYYSMFKKQISRMNPDGSKTVMEKGWFSRGTKIMVTGYRRDDMFIGKTYKNTIGHQLYKIVDVIDGDIRLQHERWTEMPTEEDYE